MSKKKEEIKEQTKEEREEGLLKDLCSDDAQLRDFLSSYLFIDPLAGVSKKGLDVLIQEGEKNGNFRPAVDKAIFESAQNPGERERYIKIIQDLATKTIRATEQEKEKSKKEGLNERASILGKRIEDQVFMSERAEKIINVAAKFYNEKLLELGEDLRREERKEERREAERQEQIIAQTEKAALAVRKAEEKGMGREARREAEKQDQREYLAGEERKLARAEERREAERQEQKIEQTEKAQREAREEDRKKDRS